MERRYCERRDMHIVRQRECGVHIDESGDEVDTGSSDEIVRKHMEPGFKDVRVRASLSRTLRWC